MSFQQKLASGKFVTLVELEPPKGVNTENFVESALRVKNRVDAFVVPEMANAVMKISSLGGCMLLANRGLETVLQVSCRDRNRLALQGDILAAHSLGINSVMVVKGEDISYGDHHQAKQVYDLSDLELLKALAGLQQGRDMAGIDLEGAPSFTVGACVNPGAIAEFAREMESLLAQKDAGAEFFVTQPVFDLQSIAGFVKQARTCGARIFPNILLLKSVGMAKAIDLHMSDVHMPSSIINRIKSAPDRRRECVEVTVELIRQVKQAGYPGVVISPLGWEDRLPMILEKAGE